MTSNRAYALLTVKSVEEDKRIIRGVATTPTVDRVGDIIEPMGVSFKNPMPFLWQHYADEPIGTVKFDPPTEKGITFEAELPAVPPEESAVLSARIDEAWSSIKRGLVRAVSIGFRAVEYAFMDEGGIRFIKTEVFELSAVTIPANAQAVITSAKSIDGDMLAALKKFDETTAPAATGKSVRVVKLNAPGPRQGKPFIIRDIRRP
jgi:HK97 family phage prohead protease